MDFPGSQSQKTNQPKISGFQRCLEKKCQPLTAPDTSSGCFICVGSVLISSFSSPVIQPSKATGAAHAEINGNKGKAWLEGHVGHRVPDQPFTSGKGSPEGLQKPAGVGNSNGHPVVFCWDCPGGKMGSGPSMGFGEYSIGGAGAGLH